MDIGANIGLIALGVLTHDPNIHIHAFEPGSSRIFLAKTIAANHLPITLWPLALSNHIGEELFVSHNSDLSGMDGLMDTRRVGTGKLVKVPVTTLDAWWIPRGQPRVDVIKIDTEGAELWVLQGATKLIQSCRPVIYLEIEEQNLKVYPYQSTDILHWFVGHQYRLQALGGENCDPSNLARLISRTDTFVGRPVMTKNSSKS